MFLSVSNRRVLQYGHQPHNPNHVPTLQNRHTFLLYVQSGNVDPSVDNMLRITSDGRKLGLDPRLIDPSFEDNPDTKLNQCVRNVTQIYHDTAEEKLTQIIFCDLGVPKKNSQSTDKGENADEKSASERESLEEECDFCVYDDIRDKLIADGIKPEEIAYVHDAKTEKQKADLFDRVNKGEVRVLLGSTGKMDTGTNCQKKLIALHNLDIPWRPSDLQQRIGRIERQGNQNSVAHVFNYVTKGSFDACKWRTKPFLSSLNQMLIYIVIIVVKTDLLIIAESRIYNVNIVEDLLVIRLYTIGQHDLSSEQRCFINTAQAFQQFQQLF